MDVLNFNSILVKINKAKMENSITYFTCLDFHPLSTHLSCGPAIPLVFYDQVTLATLFLSLNAKLIETARSMHNVIMQWPASLSSLPLFQIP